MGQLMPKLQIISRRGWFGYYAARRLFHPRQAPMTRIRSILLLAAVALLPLAGCKQNSSSTGGATPSGLTDAQIQAATARKVKMAKDGDRLIAAGNKLIKAGEAQHNPKLVEEGRSLIGQGEQLVARSRRS
jgi:hypothetical protein